MIVFVACQESNKPVNTSKYIFYFTKDIHMMCPKVKNNPNHYDDRIIMTIFDVCY